MELRQLGTPGPITSAIGVGTWRIEGVDDAEQIQAIRHARAAGVTVFDTAPVYGNGHSEEVLAQRDVCVAIVGGLRASEVDENLAAGSVRLDASLLSEVEQLLAQVAGRTERIPEAPSQLLPALQP